MGFGQASAAFAPLKWIRFVAVINCAPFPCTYTNCSMSNRKGGLTLRSNLPCLFLTVAWFAELLVAGPACKLDIALQVVLLISAHDELISSSKLKPVQTPVSTSQHTY